MVNLELKNLTCNAFQNLNLHLDRAGIYGIIGRNGAGKSTLFTIINGEMKNFNGQLAVKGGVAYVPALEIFDPNLSGNDYVGLLNSKAQKTATKLMPLFQAQRFLGKKIKTYSLGMKEILAFIYSVSLQSELIIIDELMSGLDNSMRAQAFEILHELAETKIILLTSHILEEVEQHCNKVYFLSKDGFLEVSDFEEAREMVMENEVFI